MKIKILISFFFAALAITACKKETEDYAGDRIEDYVPLVPGKFITYQLDSFKYLPFSLQDTVVSYQVKHTVDSIIKDNLGRPAYRIIRYIRRNGQEAWTADNSFMAVNTGTALEFVENNLRFVKLRLPIREGYSWKGNSFIDTYSLNSTVRYLDDWDYVYENVGQPITLGTMQLDSTIKVNERDEVIGNPADANSYSEKNYSNEVYARGIGLVYRQFLHTEFQPATPGSPSSYSDGSYGVTMTIIDHN